MKRRDGRRERGPDLLQDHAPVHAVCDYTIPDHNVYGNVNNFNVIYLLSGGDPVTDVGATAGKTDLLVTWLYKLTIDKQYYNIGAVIGILTFIILAIGALITYRNSKSYKEEGGF